VRAEGASELKLNPGLTHILQENDTVFYIGFTKEEYSKVRGPINIRHTLWHACATWAVIAMATSGINPYEVEQEYDVGGNQKGGDQKEKVEQEEVTSIGPKEDVKFYIGDRQSTELLGSDLVNVGCQKRPSVISDTSHVTTEGGSGSATPMKENLDDQVKCDVLRGVQLLRFHSQASIHAGGPVKVKIHQDSIPQILAQGSAADTFQHTTSSSTQISGGTIPSHNSTQSTQGHTFHRQGSSQSTLGSGSTQPGHTFHFTQSTQGTSQPGHTFHRQGSTQSTQGTSQPGHSFHRQGSTQSTPMGSLNSVNEQPQSSSLLLQGNGQPFQRPTFSRLSDVVEESSMEREKWEVPTGDGSAMSDKVAVGTDSLRQAEEGRVIHRSPIQNGCSITVRECESGPSHCVPGNGTLIPKAAHAASAPEVPLAQRPPSLFSQRRQTFIPPPLDLNITRSVSDGRIVETLEEANLAAAAADPNTPVSLRRGGYYSSEMSLLSPGTPSMASRHHEMHLPPPPHRSILGNLSRKLSQVERVPPVLQEEVRVYGGKGRLWRVGLEEDWRGGHVLQE
jgi:hypothetical protein